MQQVLISHQFYTHQCIQNIPLLKIFLNSAKYAQYQLYACIEENRENGPCKQNSFLKICSFSKVFRLSNPSFCTLTLTIFSLCKLVWCKKSRSHL